MQLKSFKNICILVGNLFIIVSKRHYFSMSMVNDNGDTVVCSDLGLIPEDNQKFIITER